MLAYHADYLDIRVSEFSCGKLEARMYALGAQLLQSRASLNELSNV